jgi:uncharacterized Tic20 family protein
MQPNPSDLRPEDKNWGMLAHLLTLLGYPLGFGHWIAPLVIYLTKKDSPFARGEAREALNFELSLFIYFVISLPLLCLVITIPFIVLGWIAMLLAQLVLPILAAIQAADGKPYRYPLILRLVS